MVRMETVKAPDEDYFMQLDQRISRTLMLIFRDYNEVITGFNRIPSGHAGGAQLLNTSLLNYL